MPVSPLLKIAHRPPVCVPPGAPVREAVRVMVENRVGAVAVVENDRLVGIFTERDLMVKVADAGLDPRGLTVGELMVSDPVTLKPDAARSQALDLMIKRHFRHVPVVDDDGRILGMLSIRNLLQHQLHRLKGQMDSLEAYVAADGPGG